MKKEHKSCNERTFKTTHLFHFGNEGYLFQINVLRFDINVEHLQILMDVKLNITLLETKWIPIMEPERASIC